MFIQLLNSSEIYCWPSFSLDYLFKKKSSIELLICSGRLPENSELLCKEDIVKIKRCIYGLQRDGLPPVTTHNIVDDWNDPVLNSIRRCKLFNTVHDRVKVCFSYQDLLVYKNGSLYCRF